MSLIYEGGDASPTGNVPPPVGAGTNLLQVSIDANTRALGNLASQFAAFKNSAGPGTPRNNVGYGSSGMGSDGKMWSSAWTGPSFAGFPSMMSPGGFASMGPTMQKPGTMIAPYGTGQNPAYSGASQNWGWGSGNAGYSPGQYTALGGAGGITPFNGARQQAGSNQWTYTATATPQQALPGGLAQQNQGISRVGAGSGAPPTVNNPFRTAAVVGGTLGAVGAAAVLFGKSQLEGQVVANQYTVNAQIASPVGQPFSQTNSLARFQAFGQGGRNLNAAATSYQDAAMGQAAIGYISGNVPGSVMNASGRAVQGATNAAAFFNPGLGYNGAAQLAGTMYSPQTSVNMQALGYSSTPRKIGGGKMQGTGQYVQSLLQGWYGSNSVAQKNLLATLSQGGIGTYNLQSIGYNQNQISQMTPLLEGYNKLFNQGVSAKRADQLFSQATHGSLSSMHAAQDTLTNTYGLPQSDIQALKDKKSVSTGTSSDIADSFNKALSVSVGLLGRFSQWLNDIMRGTHTTGLVGGAGGIGGALSTVGSIGGGGILATLGIRALLGGGGGLGGAVGTAGRAVGNTADSLAMNSARGAGAAWRGLSGLFDGAGAGGAGGGLAEMLGGGASAAALVALLGNAVRVRAGQPGGILGGTSNSPEFNARFGPSTTDGRPGGASAVVPSKQATPQGGKQSVGGSVSKAAQMAVHDAVGEVGVPYVYGGTTPAGFDCSGLVQWAYNKAGVSLPRTSQDQAAFLRHRGVSPHNAQEGDIVFAAGSDGSAAAPGHEALMINRHQIVEAPHTGLDVRVRAYDPGEWVFVGRPNGSLAGAGGPTGPGGTPGGGATNNAGTQGNTGMGSLMGTGVGFGASEASTLTSVDESSMLAGGGGFMGGGGGAAGGTTAAGGGQPGSGKGGAPGKKGAKTGNLTGNKRIMNNWASKFGWGTGREWNALNTLEMHEAGYDNTIKNPHSTAYGMGQFLDSTWATVGGHKTSNPNLQAEYMMKYIKGRYGDPVKAWAQYYNHPGGVGWYGAGGRPGNGEYGVVGDRGPELVKFGEGGHVVDAGKTADTLAGMHAMVQQVGSGPVSSHGGKGTINLNFGENSITISQCGHGHDQGDAARIFMRALKKHLRNEDIYAAIAEGDKF